jgi:Xaa-Pro aminopeptidase
MDCLDELLTRTKSSAYCLYASSDEPDMRYLTGFVTHDPVPVLKRPGERPIMIVPMMEAHRAAVESNAQVITRQQAGYQEISTAERDQYRITARMIQRQAQGQLIVPPHFPLALARALEEFSPVIVDQEATVASMRSVKSAGEIRYIRSAQRAVELAMNVAVALIRRSTVQNGVLWESDAPLTSERLKMVILTTLITEGYTASDTIVACGEDTAMPHCTGSGPLRPCQPIVIDIFPQCLKSGYYADMTRTVSKGRPSDMVCDLYEAVAEAVTIGEAAISDRASGAECYQKVRDYFDERGYKTDTEGFTHSLGHGVGLEVHEKPSLSPAGEQLRAGQVVTVEPGLYYRGTGGVRIENLGIVTPGGFSRITEFSQEMIL